MTISQESTASGAALCSSEVLANYSGTQFSTVKRSLCGVPTSYDGIPLVPGRTAGVTTVGRH